MRRSVLLVALVACGGRPPPQPVAATAPPPAAKPSAPDPLAALVDLAKHGPDRDTYPQADAVVASERDDITLAADGGVVEHYRSVVKLFDAQRGKEKFADVHIPYDARRQTLAIVNARTFTRDGAPHVAAPDEISDIVPPGLADATVYSDVRERVVSFPAVDKGAVLELEYVRTTKPGADAPAGGERLLATWDPVLERTVTITVPPGTTPKLEVVGAQLAPARAGDTYTFTLKDQPDRHPELNAPPEAAVLPRLVYSFAPDWNRALQSLATRFLTTAIPAVPSSLIIVEAKRITAGAKDNAAKARAIFAFVAHDIRSIDLPLGTAGYEPHAPEQVLANRYGDDRDKVALLLALCAAVQIDGRPVLVRTGKVPVLATVPTLAQFDALIAKLVVDGNEVWLDPADENGQYALAFKGQDNLVLPLDPDRAELGRRPPLDPATSVARTTASFTLARNGDLTASYRYSLTGWYAGRASETLRPLKGQRERQFFERAAGALSAGAIDRRHSVGDTLSIDGPLAITHDVTVPGYAEAQSSYRVIELPPLTLDLADDAPKPGLSTRTTPLRIGVPRTLQQDLTLTLPAGWKVAHIPPPLEGSADGLTYQHRCEATGQKVTCHVQITLSRLEIAPDNYAAFRTALAKLRAYEQRVVLGTLSTSAT